MTNQQKKKMRHLAKNTKVTPQEAAEEVGCSVVTARLYIRTFRKKARST